MTLRHDARGQAAVLTVVFLTALLGMVALVLDVGSWYREQRATQSTADAAALAAAQALPESPADARVLANEYVAKNGGGKREITFSSRVLPNDTVTVRVERDAPGVFAKLFGISSVNVGAKAAARATGLDAARWVAPIVVNIKHPKLNCATDAQGRPVPCYGDPTELELEHMHKPGSGDAAGSFGLINLDTGDTGSAGASTLGTWIARGFDQYMELGKYNSVPSAMFNDSHIKEALDYRLNDTLLFPIYNKITGSGSGAEYVIVGWVGFTVTNFVATGSTSKVFGSFTQTIWEGIQSQSGANLNFGARAIALVN